MLSPATGLATLLGAGVGFGLTLIVHGLTAAPTRSLRRGLRATRRGWLAVGVGVVVAVLTRWPVAGILAGLGAWQLRAMLSIGSDHRQAVARIEAIATWAERLRDTMNAAAGLEQAIHATAQLAPPPIRGPVRGLAARLAAGERMGPALRRFGDEVADPTADLIVAALVLAVEHQARHLGDLLGALATAARGQAQLRLRIAAARARTRTSVRVIIATTLAMAAGLILFNRSFLAPYDSLNGQLVLVAVGGLFASAVTWLVRIARVEPMARLVTGGRP